MIRSILLQLMMRTSRGDMLWLRPDAWAMPRESRVSEMLAEAMATGRRSRAIYPARALTEAPDALRVRAGLGEQVRILSEVPTRLFIFGDIVGREFWKLRPAWDVEKADLMWPETGSRGHVAQSLYRLTVRVSWYKTGKEIMDEWRAAHPGQNIEFDPGGLFRNLFVKYPGWRAREGHQQPALGIPGMDPCPPACSGEVTHGYEPKQQ